MVIDCFVVAVVVWVCLAIAVVAEVVDLLHFISEDPVIVVIPFIRLVGSAVGSLPRAVCFAHVSVLDNRLGAVRSVVLFSCLG